MGKPQVATASQLRALFESYSEGNGSRFLSVAVQIAAHAAKAGHEDLAEHIRELVDTAKHARLSGVPSGASIIPMAQPTGDLAGLVSASYPTTRLVDMVLPASVRTRLDRIVREYRHSERLKNSGLSPRRKVLLTGKPGCGKSMTAAAIAGELSRPLLLVQFHALIAKFMGETAAKLHLIFQAMQRTSGVYFFDEFDAIGAQRGAANDVGEVRRVLNSFLLFLEQDNSESIIIAATNMSRILDDALFRRFDDVIVYEKPDSKMSRKLVENSLARFDTVRLGWKTVIEATADLSHADIVRGCEDAAKEAVLAERTRILTEDLVAALGARAAHGG